MVLILMHGDADDGRESAGVRGVVQQRPQQLFGINWRDEDAWPSTRVYALQYDYQSAWVVAVVVDEEAKERGSARRWL